MTIHSTRVVFPDGDSQEISHRLSIGDIVDVNGRPVRLPQRFQQILVYEVVKMTNREERGESTTLFFLEQLSMEELRNMIEGF